MKVTNINKILVTSIKLIFIMFLVWTEHSCSQTSSAKETQNSLSESKKDSSKSSAVSGGKIESKVLDVFLSSDQNKKEGGIGDDIILKIDKLEELLNFGSINKGQQLVLFIEDLPLKGVNGLPDIKNSEMKFRLTRNDSAKPNWAKILSKPSFFSGSKYVLISVGYENGTAIPTASREKNFRLIIVKALSFWISVLIIAVLFIIIIKLAKNSEMLREPCPNVETSKKPYSLALTQMAFWYFLVVVSIIMLFLITKEFPSLNLSVLALIGISSLTALSSTVINANKVSDSENKFLSLNAEKKTLSDRIVEITNTLNKNIKFAPDKILELQKEKLDKETRLNEIVQTLPKYSTKQSYYFTKGFFNDMVSDSTGVSLHRFQIVVWTLVLGFIFVHDVWSSLTLPEFDQTLLALMGISSGTYIGFKIPEAKP